LKIPDSLPQDGGFNTSMHPKFLTHTLLVCAAVLGFCLPSLSADVIQTGDGSRIVGKITKIDGGVIYITTSYAGDLSVKQDQITAIETETPLAVRLASGTRMDGVVSTSHGALQITGSDGTITTAVAKVAASWQAGGKDPAVAALERHWKYEASVDINGTNGNKSQLGTSMGFAAKLTTPADSLGFLTSYNRQVTDGAKSADQFKAGVDYTNNMSADSSWFIRDEGGFDRIMGIKFFETAAAGLGYNLLNSAHEELTGRAGLAYRYDGYNNPLTPSVNAAALDFELANHLKFATWELVTNLTVVPTMSDLSNVDIVHDSYYQIPLSNPAWKLRMGISNSYQGKPPAGIKKIDTSYFTRLVLDWQ
jgi:hypothetical protein